MAELSTEKRNELKDSDFGIPEKRMYPLHDKSHVEAAVRLFGHAAPKYRKSLARKILARAREYNLDTSGWKQVLDYAQEQVPPMSDGTSTGNQPPHTMAPYCEEDELIQRLNRATAQAATTQPVQEGSFVPAIGNLMNQVQQVLGDKFEFFGGSFVPKFMMQYKGDHDVEVDVVANGANIEVTPKYKGIPDYMLKRKGLSISRALNAIIDVAKEFVAAHKPKLAVESTDETQKDFFDLTVTQESTADGRVTDMLEQAKSIASRIHMKYEKDSKPPTGNQNCQLCTWCAEAQFRGINILPRPIYSPRDPALEIKGETIVKSPTKIKIRNKDHIVSTVKDNPGSRYYIHVKWNGGPGGHEFLIINIDSKVYIMDAQQGIVESIDKSKYFDDIDYSGSYFVRLDNKELDQTLLTKMNSMKTLVPWDWDKDVEYMKKHGMLGEDEDIRFIRYFVPSDKATEYLKKDPELKQYWEKLNKDTNGEILVDPNTKEQIGHGFVYNGNDESNEGFIFNIEVMPKYRHQGFGTIILNDCVTKFGGRDLTVDCDNEPAIHMYLKYGFEIIDKGKYSDHGEGYYMRLKKSKTVQEGAFQDLKNGVNPFSDKLVFHVTPEKYADGKLWKPRVPEYIDPYNPDEKGFEDSTTPRICFSTSIEGCLNGITVNIPRYSPDKFDKLYVYIPEKPWKEYKHKTNQQIIKEKLVYDANVTREVWIMEPVRMKLYGVIRVDQVSSVKRKDVVPTANGEKDTRNYFTYKWHWIVKPKVLDKASPYHYSEDDVLDNLCIDLKKFKYGLIRDDNTLQTDATDADYDRAWRFRAPVNIDEAGGGNCYDMVEYEAGYLSEYGVAAYKKYFMSTSTLKNKPVRTHTFLVVKMNGKYIYIEQAFKRVTAEWGYERKKSFDKLNDVFEYVAECMADAEGQQLNFGIWDYTNIDIPYGVSIKEFMEIIYAKCKMIYDGTAKPLQQKPIKEGYVMSSRFFQEEEAETTITVADVELGDDTQETDSQTPEQKPEIEESEKTPDEASDYDVDNVDLGKMGTDTSDVQNEYDPKEIEILMKLMASEADAMNEYMDGAKDTNIDVLRRLYADIANEERFHMEQLLFAKSEITGEKYEPKDPEVKSEYEELLKMGMDEESAMHAAADKFGLRGPSSGTDSEDDEPIPDDPEEIIDDIKITEMAIVTLTRQIDDFMTVAESHSYRDEEMQHAITVFMEDVNYTGKNIGGDYFQSPKGVIGVLKSALNAVLKLIGKLIRKFGNLLSWIRNKADKYKKIYRVNGRTLSAFFKDGVKFYLINPKTHDGSYIDSSVFTYMAIVHKLAILCTKQVVGAKQMNPLSNQEATTLKAQRIDIDNIASGIQVLEKTHLNRIKYIVDESVTSMLDNIFFGYTKNKMDVNGEQKSVNIYNEFITFQKSWETMVEQLNDTLDSMQDVKNQQRHPDHYKEAIDGIKVCTRCAKAFTSALSSDIAELTKINQAMINDTNAQDAEDQKKKSE